MRRCDDVYEIVTVYYPTGCVNTTRTTTSTSTTLPPTTTTTSSSTSTSTSTSTTSTTTTAIPTTTTTTSSTSSTTTTTTLPPTTTTTTTFNPCPDCISGTEVTIGTQIWTGCNLDVTTYANGDPIPEVTDPSVWDTLETGAWCYYDNVSSNGTTYSKLYNGYAVADPRGLAPVGYHIPTDAEWTTLTTYLGGTTVAGGKMKETGLCHWLDPNVGATNESGFTGLPAGYRSTGGTFYDINWSAYFWSSTIEFTLMWARHLYVEDATVYVGNHSQKLGFSVRLIKD